MQDKNQRIVCRPGKAIWAIAAIFALLSCLLMALPFLPYDRFAAGNCGCSSSASSMTDNQSRWGILSAGGVLSLLPLTLAAYALRSRIIADSRGLKWRSIGKWKEARWNEITDTYMVCVTPSGGHIPPTYYVETLHGRLLITRSGHTNCQSLLEAIRERCGIPAEEVWKEKGTRAKEDFPVLLRYRPSSFGAPLIMCVLMAAGWLWLVVHLISWIPGNFQLMGPVWGIAMALIAGGFAIFLSIPVVMLLIITITAFRCRNQQVSVYHNGLTFEDSERLIEVDWQEIESVNHAPVRPPFRVEHCTIATKKGSFDIYPSLIATSEVRTFNNLLTQCAPDAVKRGEAGKPTADEVLYAPVPAKPDQKIYTYRTRTCRAMVAFTFFFAGMVWLSPLLIWWLNVSQGSTVSNSIGMIILAIPFSIVALLSLYAYRRARIVLDNENIMTYSFFGTKTVRWNEVTSCGKEADANFYVVGDSGKISFSSLVGNYQELISEIKRRVPEQARQEWEQNETI